MWEGWRQVTVALSSLAQVRGGILSQEDSGSHRIPYFGFVLFLTILFASRFWEGHTNTNLSEAPTLLASATASKAWTRPQLMLPQALSNADISYIKGPSGGWTS